MKDADKIKYVLALIFVGLALVFVNFYFWKTTNDNIATPAELVLIHYQDSVRNAYTTEMYTVYRELSEKQIVEIKRQLETYGIYDVTYDSIHSITNIEIAEEYCNSPEYYDSFK